MSKLTITRFTHDGDEPSIMVNDGSGWSRAVPIPFYLWSFLGGWKPVCIKHKLIFQKEASYHEHYQSQCGMFTQPDAYPKSDMAILTRGYKRIWS